MAPPLLAGVFLDWQDVAGNQSDGFWILKNQIALPPTAYVGLVMTAQSLSLAACFGVVEQRARSIPAAPASGMFGSVSDQLVVVMQTPQGKRSLVIPAPKSDLFLSDGQTLNVTDRRVLAFFAQVQVYLGNQYGQGYTFLFGGYRRKVAWPTTPGVSP